MSNGVSLNVCQTATDVRERPSHVGVWRLRSLRMSSSLSVIANMMNEAWYSWESGTCACFPQWLPVSTDCINYQVIQWLVKMYSWPGSATFYSKVIKVPTRYLHLGPMKQQWWAVLAVRKPGRYPALIPITTPIGQSGSLFSLLFFIVLLKSRLCVKELY